ncbi:hypothetical protein C0Q70_12484 [Pomacea canaliculata]|uniref:Uncharacterized protein n=1 Tax=Pomacea canaliculata TaxID=400727 RepID=A0A2T7P1M8_POMCA|nr:hypothetical protein C0Q70_12484 [Pomacea canaliculata]
MEKSDGECPGMLIPRVDATYLFIRVIVGEAEGKSERQTPLSLRETTGVAEGSGRRPLFTSVLLKSDLPYRLELVKERKNNERSWKERGGTTQKNHQLGCVEGKKREAEECGAPYSLNAYRYAIRFPWQPEATRYGSANLETRIEHR